MNVKSVVENKEKFEVELTIEVGKEEFEAGLDKVYRKSRNSISVPGFRKGKAPRKVIEGMYGAGVFYEDAVEELYPKAVAGAVEEQDLDVVAPPMVEVLSLDKDGFSFKATVTVRPVVTLEQYKGLEADKVLPTITDAAVDAELQRYIDRATQLVAVEREAKLGDTAAIDYDGFKEDGEAFAGGSAKNYDLELGSNTFIPGFEDQLVGVKAGDVKDVKVTFPENYQAENLAGKEAVFACMIKAVKVKELPAVDDEFVKEISEFDTLADYKADVKAQLTKEAQDKADRDFEDEVVEKIVDSSKVEVPAAMIEREADEMVHEFEYRLMYQGLKLDDYLKYLNMTRDQLVDQYKDQAAKTVKVRLVMEALIKAENLTIEDKEIEEKMAKFAEQSSQTVEEFKKTLHKEQVDYIVNSIMNEKLLDMLTKENLAKKAPAKKADAEAEVKDDTKTEEKKPAAKKTTKKAAKPAADAE